MGKAASNSHDRLGTETSSRDLRDERVANRADGRVVYSGVDEEESADAVVEEARVPNR